MLLNSFRVYDIFHLTRLSQEEETYSADDNGEIVRIENVEKYFCKDILSSSHIDKAINNMFPKIVDIKYVIEADMFNKNRLFSKIYVSVVLMFYLLQLFFFQ